MATVLLPVTIGLIEIADLAWTYHSLVTLTRRGAQYAATHCWQDDAGSNVVNWMSANAPPFMDRPLLQSGGMQIQVNYWAHDLSTHQTLPFSCADSCTPQCVPDSVTISISGYQYRHLLPVLGLQPIQVPSFSTTVEVESAGGNPETGTAFL